MKHNKPMQPGRSMSDQSLEIWKNLKQSQLRYEYYIIGLAAALFAYLGSSFKPEALSVSQNSFELLSLIALFFTVVTGLFRLENDLSAQATKLEQQNAQSRLDVLNKVSMCSGRVNNVDAGEELNKEDVEKQQQRLKEFIASANEGLKILNNRTIWYLRVRNFSLFFGFFFLVVSKLISFFNVLNAV